MQADLRRALKASSLMPTTPLARPLASLVSQYGWAASMAGGDTAADDDENGIGCRARESGRELEGVIGVGEVEYNVVVKGGVMYMGDIGFWKELAEHPRSQPYDVMPLLRLLAQVLLTDAHNSTMAGGSISGVCRNLLRHTSVRTFLERTVANALGALTNLYSDPAELPPGAMYGRGGGERHESNQHTRALESFVKNVGLNNGSRHVVLDALRAALALALTGGAASQELKRLLDLIQGPHHLSVIPSLLPPVVGSSHSPQHHELADRTRLEQHRDGRNTDASASFSPIHAPSLHRSPPPLDGGAEDAAEPSGPPAARPSRAVGAHREGENMGGESKREGYSDLENRRRDSREGGKRDVERERDEGSGRAKEKGTEKRGEAERKERETGKERTREKEGAHDEPAKVRARDQKHKRVVAQGDAGCKEAFEVHGFKSMCVYTYMHKCIYAQT